jgi:hypothetical protein
MVSSSLADEKRVRSLLVVARRRKACPLAPPPSIGARSELYCSLRSLQIVLEPDGVVLLADEKRVRSLLLHPAARDLS